MALPGFAAQLMEDLPPGDVRHVLLVFGADLQRMQDALQRQAAAQDETAFRRTAHALAGAASAVGAVGLEAACRAAMQLPSGQTVDLAADLATIEGAAAQAAADLQSALRRLKVGDG